MRASCGTCVFWKRNDNGDTKIGDCRIRAPRMHVYTTPVQEQQLVKGILQNALGLQVRQLSAFPQTNQDIWCGEHRSRLNDVVGFEVGLERVEQDA